MQLSALVFLLVAFSTLLSPSLTWRRRRRRRCPYRNCAVAWTPYSACTKTCGGGTRYRRLYKTVSEQCGGKCSYRLGTYTYSCSTQCCRVNCQWQWGPWSSCSGCGMSTQTRRVRVTRPPSCGGTACPTSSQTRRCNTGA